LPSALDAILAQTYGDFEVVISDNASTDNTPAICADYAARDSRIIYRREAVNHGAAWNFNRVFELASAPYFKWTAADDLVAPEFIASCMKILEADPTIVCCHSRTQKIDEHGKPIPGADDPTDGGLPSHLFLQPGARGHYRPDGSSRIPHQRFRDVLLSSGWSARSYGVIRRQILGQTNLFEPYYGYEKVIMGELALHGRMHDIPETLFYQREHEQASSRLTTTSARHRFFTAQAKSRKGTRWPLLRGHVRAISRAPIDSWQRSFCSVWLLRYLLQINKWPAVLNTALLGRSGANKRKIAPRSTNAACAVHHQRPIVHQEH